jgi:ABC-type multidrug transport system fused ATPase/permease subunit
MFSFLLQLYRLTRPKKGRFALGILCGILAGLSDGVLFGAVVLVLRLLFPTSQAPSAVQSGLDAQLRKYPWLQHGLEQTQGYVSDHHQSVGLIASIILIIPVVMLLRCVIIYLNGYLMSWVVVRAIADLRARAFEHLLNLPLSFFSANSTGE